MAMSEPVQLLPRRVSSPELHVAQCTDSEIRGVKLPESHLYEVLNGTDKLVSSPASMSNRATLGEMQPATSTLLVAVCVFFLRPTGLQWRIADVPDSIGKISQILLQKELRGRLTATRASPDQG